MAKKEGENIEKRVERDAERTLKEEEKEEEEAAEATEVRSNGSEEYWILLLKSRRKV